MQLVTYTNADASRLGALLDETHVVDLGRASGGAVPADMLAFLNAGDPAMAAARTALEEASAAGRAGVSASNLIFPLDDGKTRLAAPVPRPGKALAIGLNYRDHAAETNAELPKHPVVFSKVTTCITGPGMPIHKPAISNAVDWEGELCFVVGKRARRVSAANALDYVAGYTIGNDVSVRDWQFHAPTWTMGKGWDTHGPMGPALVTKDEVPGIASAGIRTFVNGEQVQKSTISNLIFGVAAIIEYLCTAFTLEPGDVVFTGTPAGVGVAMKPPRFLKPGDVVRVEIDGLGALENPVIEEPR